MRRKRKIPENIPASTQRLLEFVEASGLTQSEFARRVGITPAGFGNLFSRGTEISGPLARAIELEFGVSHRWIINGEESQHENEALDATHIARLMLDLLEFLEDATDAARQLDAIYRKGEN